MRELLLKMKTKIIKLGLSIVTYDRIEFWKKTYAEFGKKCRSSKDQKFSRKLPKSSFFEGDPLTKVFVTRINKLLKNSF